MHHLVSGRRKTARMQTSAKDTTQPPRACTSVANHVLLRRQQPVTREQCMHIKATDSTRLDMQLLHRSIDFNTRASQQECDSM